MIKIAKITLTSVIIFVFFMPLNLMSRESDALDEFNLASKVFREDKTDSALAKYENFINEYPSHSKTASAHFMAGECLFKQKKYARAATYYQRVVRKYPKEKNLYINALYRLGECNFNLGKYLRALKLFKKAMNSKNKILRAEAIYGIALCHLAVDEKEKAKNQLLELLQFYPGYQNNREVVLPLSLIMIEDGELKEALEHLKKLPDDPAALFYSGVALKNMNKIMEANVLFKEILQNDPEGPWADKAQSQIGEAFYQSKQFTLSSESFQRLLMKYPESPLRVEAIYRLASADFQNEVYGDAVLKFDKIIQNNPEHEFYYPSLYLQAETSLRQRDWALALKKFSELLAINQIAMHANFKIVWLYSRAGQYDLAIAQANQFLKDYQWGDLAAKVYLIQAFCYQNIQKFDKALRCYQKIVDLFPNSIFFEKALYLKATCYYKAKLYPELVTNIYEIVKNSPASPTIWRAKTYYWIAEGYYALEKYELAREVFEIVVRNYPDLAIVPQILQAISSCHAYEKNFEMARIFQEKALTRAMEIRDKGVSSISILEIANILFNQTQYEKSVTYYDEFIQKNPSDPKIPKALYQQGIALYRLQYYTEAIKRWQRLYSNFRSDPLASKALFQTGKTYFGLERYDNAIRAFLNLTNSYPNSEFYKDAYLQIGQAYYNRGAIENAINQYKSFVLNYPDDERVPSVLEQLQMSYYRLGKTSEELEKLVSQFPKSRFAADTYWKLGAKAFNDKDYTKAHEYFQKIILNFPESTQINKAYYYEAETCFMEEKNSEAAIAYENFITNFPKDEMTQQSRFRLGASYFKSENYSQAVVAFTDFIDLYPDSSLVKDCFLNIALSYKKSQQPNESIEAYKRYIKKFPDDPKMSFAQMQVGLQYEAQQKFKEAIDSFRDVSKVDRMAHLEALFYIGRSYHQLKVPEEEEKVYSEMMGLTPRNNEFRIAGLLRLAEIYENSGNIPGAVRLYRDIAKNSANRDWSNLANEKVRVLSQ